MKQKLSWRIWTWEPNRRKRLPGSNTRLSEWLISNIRRLVSILWYLATIYKPRIWCRPCRPSDWYFSLCELIEKDCIHGVAIPFCFYNMSAFSRFPEHRGEGFVHLKRNLVKMTPADANVCAIQGFMRGPWL